MSLEEAKATVEELDKTLILPDGRTITLNDEQYDAVKKIRKWIKDKKSHFFTLAGFAGTGKTTVIKKIIDEYKPQYGVGVSATTHKAKKVIMRTTGKDGLTIHKILGLRPDVDLDDFDPNNPKFNQKGLPTMRDYKLIIIDESSMINKELFNLIKKEINKTRGTQILFMGDPAQIPPVNEKKSVVFFDTNIEKVELTKIMRQKDGNPLLEFYTIIRNNLTVLNNNIIRETTINNIGEGVYFFNNKNAFRDQVLPMFASEEYENDFDYVKILSWRNETVRKSNLIVREHLFGKDAKYIEIGDVLMGYRSISNRFNDHNIIENSADYRVVNIGNYDQNSYGLWGYVVTINEPIDDKHKAYETIFIVDHTNEDNLHNYGEIHDLLVIKAKANKKKWKDYYNFRRENILMTPIQNYRDGSNRPSGKKIVKDIDYGFAITTHKSQGSTYQNVVILENDINVNHIIKERNQIKYVAFTRPTHSAIVLSRLTVN
jgi:exodeoxyribonuclease-5